MLLVLKIFHTLVHTPEVEKVMNVVNMLLDIIKDNGILINISHLKKSVSITDGRDVIVKRVPAMPEGLASRLGYNAEAIVTLEVDQAGQTYC